MLSDLVTLIFDLDLRVMSRDAFRVVNICAKFEADITYHYTVGTTTFSIDRLLKVPIYAFWGYTGRITSFTYLTPKGTSLAGTTYNDVLCVRMCPKMRTMGVIKKG